MKKKRIKTKLCCIYKKNLQIKLIMSGGVHLRNNLLFVDLLFIRTQVKLTRICTRCVENVVSGLWCPEPPVHALPVILAHSLGCVEQRKDTAGIWFFRVSGAGDEAVEVFGAPPEALVNFTDDPRTN